MAATRKGWLRTRKVGAGVVPPAPSETRRLPSSLQPCLSRPHSQGPKVLTGGSPALVSTFWTGSRRKEEGAEEAHASSTSYLRSWSKGTAFFPSSEQVGLHPSTLHRAELSSIFLLTGKGPIGTSIVFAVGGWLTSTPLLLFESSPNPPPLHCVSS